MNVKILTGILALTFLAAGALAQDTKPDINTLGWMSGCWELNDKQSGVTISEHWMKPAGQMLMGMGRTVKGDKTLEFESLRIVRNETGTFYIARPSSAKEETSFKLIRAAKNEAVFENLTHDFPQRIIYRSDKADSLSARIESGDAKRGMDIPMQRVKCE
jgi:hypothetical protein